MSATSTSLAWMKNPTVIIGTLIGTSTIVMWGANAITRPARQEAQIKELVARVDKMQSTMSALERDFAVISDRVTRMYRDRTPRDATPNQP